MSRMNIKQIVPKKQSTKLRYEARLRNGVWQIWDTVTYEIVGTERGKEKAEEIAVELNASVRSR